MDEENMNVDYVKRRQKITNLLADNSILVIFSAKILHRNGDVNYQFRQNSNFYYFSGFDYPNAALVFIKKSGNSHCGIFCKENNPSDTIWNGETLGPKQAKSDLNFDFADDISNLDGFLLENINSASFIYTEDDSLDNMSAVIQDSITVKIKSNKIFHKEVSYLINELRIIKDHPELEIIRKAATISVEGHLYAMQNCKPGMREYQLEALLLKCFCSNGARAVAYESIVASGINACTLHYVKNNATIKNGDLVLIDAGAEFENYAADITRTFAVNASFSSAQKEIYNLVLRAQNQVIANVKPGVSWGYLIDIAARCICDGLVSLNIIAGSTNQAYAKGLYKKYYMHSFGHWLGLDVHDVGRYKNSDGSWRTLEPGMVFTVEPGIYITQDPAVSSKWHGIGVRIEDDIVVTANGCEVLTAALPKEVSDLESIIGALV